MINTKHGIVETPNFFPVIGWPAGRGEYDRLFRSLDYFAHQVSHNHFLFNFGSFAFGFTIPKKDFNSHYEKFKDQDLRKSLIENTGINKEFAKYLIILLDNGGNRIFNKIVDSGKDPFDFKSYELYLNAYFEFVSKTDPDIYVSFDIGPSYTTRDETSKKGCQIWSSASHEQKARLNEYLLNESAKRKLKDKMMMVVVSATDIDSFKNKLKYLFTKFGSKIDYLAIGGIADKNIEFSEKVLSILRNFIDENKWAVKVHGLGMGGLKNIPLIVKYKIDTCDVATPWRRACTDAVSNMYVPLFDADLNFTGYKNALEYHKIYDEAWDKIECSCPFCKDMKIKKIAQIYKKSDKRNTKKREHLDEYYQMRVRIFYHNLYQHLALLKKLDQYQKKYGDQFINQFIKDLPLDKLKKRFSRLI